jgi:NADH:ubiquinone oxidoreductase subunit 5 (subunit L)/multisubunit Na+/H+ antiporter MnhA subunit
MRWVGVVGWVVDLVGLHCTRGQGQRKAIAAMSTRHISMWSLLFGYRLLWYLFGSSPRASN